jgi:hypothetical protein
MGGDLAQKATKRRGCGESRGSVSSVPLSPSVDFPGWRGVGRRAYRVRDGDCERERVEPSGDEPPPRAPFRMGREDWSLDRLPAHLDSWKERV